MRRNIMSENRNPKSKVVDVGFNDVQLTTNIELDGLALNLSAEFRQVTDPQLADAKKILAYLRDWLSQSLDDFQQEIERLGSG